MTQLHPYAIKYVNGDSRALTLMESDDLPDVYRVLARTGSFGGPPYIITYDESPDGAEAAATGVSYSRGSIVIPVLITEPENRPIYLWQILDEISDVLAPVLSDGKPNRGYIYFTRYQNIATPDTWRIPVAPMPFILDKPAGETLNFYQSELKFICLSSFWEADPTTDVVVKDGLSSWSSHTYTETPGGNAECFPTWEFDGPASGSINTIRIENQTTGEHIEMTNLGLGNNETLVITTGFLQKDITLNGASVYRSRSQDSTFWMLRPGANVIAISKDAASSSAVRLSYRKRRSGF